MNAQAIPVISSLTMPLAILATMLPLACSITIFLLTFFKQNTSNVNRKITHYIAIFAQFCAFVSASILFGCYIIYINIYAKNNSFAAQTIHIANFISINGVSVSWGIAVNSISIIMLFVVNSVSLCVQVYSTKYMSHEDSVCRFFAYIALFTFFMLLLCVSPNLLQFIAGWEGVGLCSYLLIAYWFNKKSATTAAFKAFLINRISDVFLFMAAFYIYIKFGSFNFNHIITALPQALSNSNITHAEIDILCIAIVIGVMAKSAQFGLHTWLPLAMEGPTPVSALIHAATMVVAGIVLLLKLSFLVNLSPTAQIFIMCIGAITALFGAIVATAQTDIKASIAYSTISQIGFMFVAVGCQAYSVAMFHLFTHAFFKASLFLASGEIIHGLNGEQNMQKMSGSITSQSMLKHFNITAITMAISGLALAGIYPLSGYYSKDAIVEAAFFAAPNAVFSAIIAAIVLSALYTFRMFFATFFATTVNTVNHPSHANVHAGANTAIGKNPMAMKSMSFVLALASVFSGLFGFYVLRLTKPIDNFFQSDASILSGILSSSNILNLISKSPQVVKVAPMSLSLVAIFASYLLYVRLNLINKNGRGRKGLVGLLSHCVKFVKNAFFINEAYSKIAQKLFNAIAKICTTAENLLSDGVYSYTQSGSKMLAMAFKSFSSGHLVAYVSVFAATLMGVLYAIMH